jgi:hypothetical protein
MINELKAEDFLDADPKDPKLGCDEPIGNPWEPCDSSSRPSYRYTDSGSDVAGTTSPCVDNPSRAEAYQLVLVKEGGGVSYFCSP